jgi:hypothetical protein
MKIVGGYFEAYAEIAVDENVNEREAIEALADMLSDRYFTCVHPDQVSISELYTAESEGNRRLYTHDYIVKNLLD